MAIEREGDEPRVDQVPLVVRPRPKVGVEVATPYTPAPPFETRRLLEAGWLVVARPVQVREPPVPIYVKEPEKGADKVRVEVATLAKVLALVKYGMLPMTALVEVPRPLNEMALAEIESGKEAEVMRLV